MMPRTRNQWLIAGTAVLVLLCATLLLDNPRPWLPWPTHQVLLALLSEYWALGYLLELALVPLFFFVSLAAVWNAKRLGVIVLGGALSFGILSAMYLIGSWPYGLRWQGLAHTATVTVVNAVGVSVIVAIAWIAVRRKSRQLSVAAHFGTFVMLSWCAFPYLGELP